MMKVAILELKAHQESWKLCSHSLKEETKHKWLPEVGCYRLITEWQFFCANKVVLKSALAAS